MRSNQEVKASSKFGGQKIEEEKIALFRVDIVPVFR